MDIHEHARFAEKSALRKSCRRFATVFLLLPALLLGLSIIDAVSVGRPLDYYLEFPPLKSYAKNAGFSWIEFFQPYTFSPMIWNFPDRKSNLEK